MEKAKDEGKYLQWECNIHQHFIFVDI